MKLGLSQYCPTAQGSAALHTAGALHAPLPYGVPPGGQSHAPSMHCASASVPFDMQHAWGTGAHAVHWPTSMLPGGHSHCAAVQIGGTTSTWPQAFTHAME